MHVLLTSCTPDAQPRAPAALERSCTVPQYHVSSDAEHEGVLLTCVPGRDAKVTSPIIAMGPAIAGSMRASEYPSLCSLVVKVPVITHAVPQSRVRTLPTSCNNRVFLLFFHTCFRTQNYHTTIRVQAFLPLRYSGTELSISLAVDAHAQRGRGGGGGRAAATADSPSQPSLFPRPLCA